MIFESIDLDTIDPGKCHADHEWWDTWQIGFLNKPFQMHETSE